MLNITMGSEINSRYWKEEVPKIWFFFNSQQAFVLCVRRCFFKIYNGSCSITNPKKVKRNMYCRRPFSFFYASSKNHFNKNLSDLLFLPFSFIYKVMYAHTLTYSQYTQTNIMCKKGIISSARIATQDSQSFNRILFRLHLFSPKTTFTILVFHHCTLISLVTRVIMQTHHINNIVAFNRLPVVLQVQLCVFAVTKKVHWFS